MDGKTLTEKGRRTSRSILEAGVRCVARDGVGKTSIKRVADEAGVGKRAVIYYYDSRERLLEAVVRQVGDMMLDNLEQAVKDLEEPADIVERGFDVVWESITTDRALLAAWFGLHAEAVTNADFREAANYISDRLERIVIALMDAQIARGRRLRVEPDAIRVLIVANVQGLTAYYLQHGDSPGLRDAIAIFQRFLATVVTGPPGTEERDSHPASSPVHG